MVGRAEAGVYAYVERIGDAAGGTGRQGETGKEKWNGAWTKQGSLREKALYHIPVQFGGVYCVRALGRVALLRDREVP